MMEWGPPIEGETPLTADDRKGLRDQSIRTREQLNDAEFRNNSAATLKYLTRRPSRRTAPFTYDWVLKLHREMFGEVWEWAGSVRNHDLTLGRPAYMLREELPTLLGDLAYWRENWPDVLDQAVRLHHRAVFIHPFANGNGRWSRMLANILLKQSNAPLVQWPADITKEASAVRTEYLCCLHQADEGDFNPLYALHARLQRPASS